MTYYINKTKQSEISKLISTHSRKGKVMSKLEQRGSGETEPFPGEMKQIQAFTTRDLERTPPQSVWGSGMGGGGQEARHQSLRKNKGSDITHPVTQITETSSDGSGAKNALPCRI